MYIQMYYNIMETKIRWNPAKSEWLKKVRGVSFEDIILQAEVVGKLEHTKRAGQKLLLFCRKGYIWVAPFVYDGKEIFLKTLYPSRKYTKLVKKGELL